MPISMSVPLLTLYAQLQSWIHAAVQSFFDADDAADFSDDIKRRQPV